MRRIRRGAGEVRAITPVVHPEALDVAAIAIQSRLAMVRNETRLLPQSISVSHRQKSVQEVHNRHGEVVGVIPGGHVAEVSGTFAETTFGVGAKVPLMLGKLASFQGVTGHVSDHRIHQSNEDFVRHEITITRDSSIGYPPVAVSEEMAQEFMLVVGGALVPPVPRATLAPAAPDPEPEPVAQRTGRRITLRKRD